MNSLQIYTWGSNRHSKCPIEKSQKNFNVAGISSYKPYGVNLKKVDGRDPRLQKHIERQKKFELYMDSIKKAIKENSLTCISIYCHKGRHRSVATAELLAQDLKQEYNVTITHLDL